MPPTPEIPLAAPPLSPVRSGDRVLVLAPHPDDESIASGGLLAQACTQGAAVRVVVATSGENNPWAQRAWEGRLLVNARARMRFAGLRERETLEALQAVGGPPEALVFLRLPDQGLTHLLLRDPLALVARLVEHVQGFAPTLLAAPSALDLHPDHSALAVAAELTLATLPATFPPPRLLAYVVHNPRARRAGGQCLRLSATELARKRLAIACHASQLVLRGGFLRSFAATGAERFNPNAVPPPGPPHPVEDVQVRGDGVVVRLRPRLLLRAWGPVALLLLGADPNPGLRLPLPPLARRSRAIEYATRSVRGECRIHRAGAVHEVLVPTSVLPPSSAFYLKMERRFGFFDEAGWVRVECEPT